MALGRDDLLNRVWQGLGMDALLGASRPRLLLSERDSLADRGVPSLVTHRRTHVDQIAVVPRGRRTVTYEKTARDRLETGPYCSKMTEWLIDSTRSNLDGFTTSSLRMPACLPD